MRKGLIVVIMGLVVLLIAVVGIVYLVNQGRAARPTPPPTTGGGEEPVTYVPEEGMVEIVVAAQNIPRGVRITEDNQAVVLMPWPDWAVPPDALTDLESAYGRIARTDIALGLPILRGMLTEEAGDLGAVGSDAALLIPSGRVGYTFAVAGNASVAWAIQPGDHVDVLISLLVVDLDEEFQSPPPHQANCLLVQPGETCEAGLMGRMQVLPSGTLVNVVPAQSQWPRLVTQLTVQDAIVLRVGSWEEQPVVTPETQEAPPEEGAQATPAPSMASRWLTVAVTPQDALVLKYAEEAGASMDLVLRSASDSNRGVVLTEAVDMQYIFERFAIEVPPKLPYGITPPVRSLRTGAAGEVVDPYQTTETGRKGATPVEQIEVPAQ